VTPHPPPHPYQYPPPAVYVPPPVDPLDFQQEAEPEPPPRRRRREGPRGGGTRGLVIALVVLAAVGLGWFGYVSVRSEWDRARLQEIPLEAQSLMRELEEIRPRIVDERTEAGRTLREQNGPRIEELERRAKRLVAEWEAIHARHPEWPRRRLTF
jgi:hypothetical protein